VPKNLHPLSKSAVAASERRTQTKGPGKRRPASVPRSPEKSPGLPLRDLLDVLDIGVANVTPHGQVRYANRRFVEILGIPRHRDLTGDYLKKYVSAESWESLDAALAEAVHGTLEGQMNIYTGEKSKVLRLTLVPIKEEYGEVSISLEAHEVTELVETSRALHESEASLQSLSGRILYVQDEERRRIARELHDNTGQELAVIAIGLDQLAASPDQPPERVRQQVRDCVQMVHKVEDEIRTLSYLLHPPLLDQLGLGAALKWYAEGFSKRSGIHVQTDVPQKSPRFSTDREIALFRVVQESLANVLRHSGSRTARLMFSVSDDVARVSVEDEGHGMDTHKLAAANAGKTLGVGIGGMRERMRQLGGKLEIHSHPGRTRIVASLPVTQISPQEATLAGVEERAHEDEGIQVSSNGARKRILVADDHEVTRRGIRSLFAGEPDFEIVGEASDGLEAVVKAKELKPDLIIMDLIMPRVGGFTAVNKIHECGLPTKILIVTTHSFAGLERAIRAAGCDGFVLKSNASGDLVRGARAALEGQFFGHTSSSPPRSELPLKGE
jgi:two-component system, NarL family, sensor kinase